MKKLKEFLIFPASIILIIGIFVGMFFILAPNDAYYSNSEFLKLLINDPMLIPALIITFTIPSLVALASSVIGTLVMLFLKLKKKMDITRKNFFITLPTVCTASSFAYFLFFTDATQKTAELNTSFQMGIFALIFSIIIAIIITFIFWLIELTVVFIKFLIRKIKEQKTSN